MGINLLLHEDSFEAGNSHGPEPCRHSWVTFGKGKARLPLSTPLLRVSGISRQASFHMRCPLRDSLEVAKPSFADPASDCGGVLSHAITFIIIRVCVETFFDMLFSLMQCENSDVQATPRATAIFGGHVSSDVIWLKRSRSVVPGVYRQRRDARMSGFCYRYACSDLKLDSTSNDPDTQVVGNFYRLAWVVTSAIGKSRAIGSSSRSWSSSMGNMLRSKGQRPKKPPSAISRNRTRCDVWKKTPSPY